MAAPPVSPDLAELRAFCVAADLGTFGRCRRPPARLPARPHQADAEPRGEGGRHAARALAPGRHAHAGGPAAHTSTRGRCCEVADQVGEVMAGIRAAGGLVRLACSHSAAEAFVAAMLAAGAQGRRVELVTARLAGGARPGGGRPRGPRGRRLAPPPHAQPRRARAAARRGRGGLRRPARPPLGPPAHARAAGALPGRADGGARPVLQRPLDGGRGAQGAPAERRVAAWSRRPRRARRSPRPAPGARRCS